MDITTRGLQITRGIRHAGRLAQITNVFARHGLYSVFEAMGIKTWLTPEQVREAEEISKSETSEGSQAPAEVAQAQGTPARLRSALEELGPAFVKLGQVLATREDLLPKAHIDELRKLHHNVSGISFDAVRTVLQQELGEQKLARFKHIEQKPIAAGSIGQVHAATLQDGRKVVIKVQRPNIQQQVEMDLSLMEVLAGMLEKYIPETKAMRPRSTIEEFTRATLSELDFIREAGNTTKVAANFAGKKFAEVPEVIWELTSPKVLTLQFLDGVPLSDKEGMVQQGNNPTMLLDHSLNIFLQMVFVDGLFHGDLHPGNLLSLRGNHIGIIDCGLTVSLGRAARERLAGLLMALVDEDYEQMVSHFVELADPDPSFNIEAFQHEVANALAPFVGLKLSDIRTGRLLWDFGRIAARHGAPMPRELIMFLRTLVSFEGISSRLDPHFDIFATCQKFARELVSHMYNRDNLQRQGLLIARDLAGLARYAPRQIRGLLKAAIEGNAVLNVESESVRSLAGAINRAVSRLAISVIIGALLIASSILIYARVGTEYNHIPTFGLVGFAFAGVLGLYVIWSMFRGGKI